MEEEAMVDYDLSAMSNRLLYQVTLASGRIITSPDSFGDEETVLAIPLRPRVYGRYRIRGVLVIDVSRTAKVMKSRACRRIWS